MIRPTPLRAPTRTSTPTRTCKNGWRFPALALAAWMLPATGWMVRAQAPEAAAPAAGTTTGYPAATLSKRQVRAAEQAYMTGAKQLEQNHPDDAEREFTRALNLNPENHTYALAVSIVHQRRVGNLVRRATQARMEADDRTADRLIAEARTLDPENPLVIEHVGPFVRQAAAGGLRQEGSGGLKQVAERTALPPNASPGWRIEGPVLADATRLKPEDTVKSFDLRGRTSEVIHNVASAYGIRVVIDDSVEQKTLRFEVENVNYERAMSILMDMTGVFVTPIDETTVVVARDTPEARQRFERQVQETIYLPGLKVEQINELAQVVRSVFDVRQAAIDTGLGGMVIRAPQDMLRPMNETLKELIDGSGEVMIEVKLYEVDTTHDITAGTTIPTQFSVFNIDQAANAIVNSNQTLIDQAIAQGFIKAGTSNLEIALALIKLGLVQSSLASNLIGVIGGGLLKTGISASTNSTFNLGLNSSDTRTLDDVQLRVGDREAAVFRAGSRYPITQSTFSTGISPVASELSNASINGVSVSSLLQQFAGGGSVTIPQITYEDLGITLKATPVIEKSGRINLLLDMKIEALSGSALGGNPILNSRQFSSDLTVADGESALMVSNVTKSESAAMTGFPGLSELPGFQLPLEDNRQRQNSQLVVVVTPHIVRRRSELTAGPRIAMAGRLAD